MANPVVDSIKENKKHQKDFMVSHFLTHKFTHEDRLLIAKMLKQEYKEGFINGSKLKHENNKH